MKTIFQMKTWALLIIMSTTMFMSCKKDNTTTNGAPNLSPGKAQLSLTASGATSGDFKSVDLTSNAAKTDLLINISGSNASIPIKMLMFSCPKSIATGTYNFNDSSDDGILLTYSVNGDGWAASQGDNFTVTIVKNDGTNFEANFSGTMKNDDNNTTINVTNGKIYGKF